MREERIEGGGVKYINTCTYCNRDKVLSTTCIIMLKEI